MRYLILVLLNLPIIILGFMNIITQYKLKKVDGERFKFQIILWLIILVVLLGSFPLYNYSVDKPLFDSSELSLFDIVEITVIIYLIYIINDHRRKLERSERIIRDLHQEISIRLSEK
jgi:hypothetical protein